LAVNPAHAILGSKKEAKVKAKLYTMTLVLACLAAVAVWAAEKDANEKPVAAAVKADVNVPATKDGIPLTTELDKFSYAMGAQVGQSLRRQGTELNIELFVSGLKESMAGIKPALAQAEMRTIMMEFRKRSMEKMQQRQKVDAAKSLAEGQAFLAANKNKEGVKVLPSGLQYKVVKAGTGKRPTAADRVKTHYRGRLIDGTEFDSSYSRGGRPAEFGVGRVIRGWTEALQLMREGAKWELYIPPNLAYDTRGMPPKIGPNSTLIFEIELIEVLPQKPAIIP
jgi:FKBP-type peptidyl-prolyl cis-trans isomerase